MRFLLDSLWQAFGLIAHVDEELLSALLVTLRVSLSSTLIASLMAVPLALLIARREFRGKRLLLLLLRTSLAHPTVMVGLFVYAFIARNAPLGGMHLLFSPTAIVIGQVLLIGPLITAIAHSALAASAGGVHEEALLLGATPFQASLKVIVELRSAILTALMTGFGRVISEVGVSLMLGGNIRGVTRTITTAITLETSQGEFSLAFALGLVLLLLVLILNLLIQVVGGQMSGGGRNAL